MASGSILTQNILGMPFDVLLLYYGGIKTRYYTIINLMSDSFISDFGDPPSLPSDTWILHRGALQSPSCFLGGKCLDSIK